ncbi:MAG TPA: Rieske 2Fe-2S domain-containing protein [Burkholderiales bacterium]|nr:Rieske 2Fe-2S domain-containing protein [Burkholderiales bacterium]
MVSAEENKLLTQVGPGTPAGELLRRYWYPIAALGELDENPVKPVTLLGESLVLYRDRRGTLGLIDSVCAHRRVNLALGVPEEEGLRCPYHGWRFGETGQCLEQPAEKRPYCDKVKIKAYPVRVACGAVFAYLGPLPVPELPMWDLMTAKNVLHEIAFATVPCNWFQSIENAVDQDHLDWLHVAFSDYVLERNGRPDLKKRFWRPGEFKGEGDRGRLKEMLYERNERGILRRAVYGDRSKDHPDWRLGIQVVFPNFARAVNDLQIRVPVDDTHHTYFLIRAHWLKPGEQAQQDKIPYFRIPVPFDGMGNIKWADLDAHATQDMAAWVAQGPIADRTKELLGESDKGIRLFRQIFREQIQVVAEGKDPMNVFRDPEEARHLHIPHVEDEDNWGYQQTQLRSRARTANKWSPVLKEMVVKYFSKEEAAEILKEPVH